MGRRGEAGPVQHSDGATQVDEGASMLASSTVGFSEMQALILNQRYNP